MKLRNLRWETGPVIPESIKQDTLSIREKEYFMQYNSLLTDYNTVIGLDLTSDLEVNNESVCINCLKLFIFWIMINRLV